MVDDVGLLLGDKNMKLELVQELKELDKEQNEYIKEQKEALKKFEDWGMRAAKLKEKGEDPFENLELAKEYEEFKKKRDELEKKSEEMKKKFEELKKLLLDS